MLHGIWIKVHFNYFFLYMYWYVCMYVEVEGPAPRGRPKRTWREVVKEDCQARKLNTEDAMDRSKWRKLIKDVRWSGWVWVGEFLLVSAYPGSPGSTAVKRLCVCVGMSTKWTVCKLLTLLPSSALMPSVQMLKISSEAATKLTGSMLKFSVGTRLNARAGFS